MRMLRNLSEKLKAKFPAASLSNSMVKTTHQEDAFSDISELETSPVVGQSQPQKDRKKRKRKGEKHIKKNEKRKDLGYFLVQK